MAKVSQRIGELTGPIFWAQQEKRLEQLWLEVIAGSPAPRKTQKKTLSSRNRNPKLAQAAKPPLRIENRHPETPPLHFPFPSFYSLLKNFSLVLIPHYLSYSPFFLNFLLSFFVLSLLPFSFIFQFSHYFKACSSC